MMIEIGMSLDEKVTKRGVMTFIDWLSQVGGLMAMLVRIIYVVITTLNFDSLSQVLVRKLYFVQSKIKMEINQTKVSDEEAHQAFKSRQRVSKVMFVPKLKAYFSGLRLLFCKRRYKPTHEQRIERKGMKKLQRELNIVNIIKQIRFLQGAVNFLTNRTQRRWIYMQARYNVIQDYVPH